jgi:hypothetical protein
MRNDARPIGHESSHRSPVASHQPDVVGHRREVDRRPPQSTVVDRWSDLLDLDGDDPVMPADDSTLRIRI